MCKPARGSGCSTDGGDVNFSGVLNALRVAWWLPVVGLVVGAGTALSLSLLATPLYSAHTQLFVSTTDSRSTSEVFQGSQFSQQRVASYAQLLGGEELAKRVIASQRLDLTPQQLAQMVSATAVPDTVLLDVTVTDVDPARAQRIATAVGSEFTKLVD